MSAIDEILASLSGLPDEQRIAILEEAARATSGMKWLPSPGAQAEAFFSPADILLYGGAGGGGKALALDTLLPTPVGWTTMKDVAVGDTLFDKDGNPCRVVAATPVMIGRPCYRVNFRDGSSIVADAEHQWVTFTADERLNVLKRSPEWQAKRREKRPSRAGQGKRLRPDMVKRNAERTYNYLPLPEGGIRTTEQIAQTILANRKRVETNHSIKVCGAINLPDQSLPIDPYLFGAWLGDGTTHNSRLVIAEDEMVEHVSYAAAASGWGVTKGATKYDYGVVGGMKAALRENGVLGKKSVPQQYLRASVSQRIALLQGLMDTDGYVTPGGSCEFTTTSEQIRDGILELLWSLGIQATCTTGRATLNGKDCGEKYRVKFTTHVEAFRLTRKLERQKNAKLRPTIYHRYITSVEPIKSVPVRCIEVDSPSHTYLCGRQMIPTHNSDLLLGLAMTSHQRSLIVRRKYANLSALTERAIQIHGSRNGFNGSPPPLLRTEDGRFIQFAGCQHPGDEADWQGHAFDLKGLDEVTQILESQVRFHLGWLRSTTPGQRVRCVMASNPPISAEGDWIIGFFKPWLDLTHPNPAKHGELRWYVTAPDGSDLEVDGPQPVQLAGQANPSIPMSRTFIPAKLADNPYLVDSGYQAKLDGLPEPLRSAVRDGNFMAARADADFQVIPTQWVIEAEARWQTGKPDGVMMTAMAVDIAQGGADRTVVAARYGGWYLPPVAVNGSETPDGSSVAALVVKHRRDNCPVVVDMGGGYGGDAFSRLTDNGVDCLRFNAAHKSTATAQDGSKLTFRNRRAEIWWRFREALNPDQEGGSKIALPHDPDLRADLCAPTWTLTTSGIQIESKEDIRKRIGRSTDKGDACIMALSCGELAVKKRAKAWNERPTQANLGYSNLKRKPR